MSMDVFGGEFLFLSVDVLGGEFLLRKHLARVYLMRKSKKTSFCALKFGLNPPFAP